MNISKIALQITDDIYTFYNKYEKLKTKFNEKSITKGKFTNAQYVIMCKLAYLKDVIEEVKNRGYKFAKYEKEMCILYGLCDNIIDSFDIKELTNLSIRESFSLCTYLTKYENVLDASEEFYEELKDKV